MKEKHSQITWRYTLMTMLVVIMLFSGIRFVVSVNAFGTESNFNREPQDLNDLTVNQIENNMWIKTDLTTLIDYYMYKETTYKKGGVIASSYLRYSYFVPIYDETGKPYFLTVYSTDGQQFSFEQQARNNNSSYSLVPNEKIPYQGRITALPDEERQYFQEYLMDQGFLKEEADAVILPYVLEYTVIENVPENSVISALVFLIALLTFVFFYRQRFLPGKKDKSISNRLL